MKNIVEMFFAADIYKGMMSKSDIAFVEYLKDTNQAIPIDLPNHPLFFSLDNKTNNIFNIIRNSKILKQLKIAIIADLEDRYFVCLRFYFIDKIDIPILIIDYLSNFIPGYYIGKCIGWIWEINLSDDPEFIFHPFNLSCDNLEKELNLESINIEPEIINNGDNQYFPYLLFTINSTTTIGRLFINDKIANEIIQDLKIKVTNGDAFIDYVNLNTSDKDHKDIKWFLTNNIKSFIGLYSHPRIVEVGNQKHVYINIDIVKEMVDELIGKDLEIDFSKVILEYGLVCTYIEDKEKDYHVIDSYTRDSIRLYYTSKHVLKQLE